MNEDWKRKWKNSKKRVLNKILKKKVFNLEKVFEVNKKQWDKTITKTRYYFVLVKFKLRKNQMNQADESKKLKGIIDSVCWLAINNIEKTRDTRSSGGLNFESSNLKMILAVKKVNIKPEHK